MLNLLPNIRVSVVRGCASAEGGYLFIESVWIGDGAPLINVPVEVFTENPRDVFVRFIGGTS